MKKGQVKTQTIVIIILLVIIAIVLLVIATNVFNRPSSTGNIINEPSTTGKVVYPIQSDNNLNPADDCLEFFFSCSKKCPKDLTNEKLANRDCLTNCQKIMGTNKCSNIDRRPTPEEYSKSNCLSACNVPPSNTEVDYNCIQSCLA